MSRRLFLDTNILLDMAMSERPQHEYALLLLDEFEFDEAAGYISPLSLKDVYYVLTKYSTEKEARQFVCALLDLFEVVSIDSATCRIASVSNEPDFEDGLIRAGAESIPVDLIISRDEKAYRRTTIKRMSAKEYMKTFGNVEEVAVQ